MQGNLEKHGQYELFETTHGHRILNLNNRNFYAVVRGQRGEILVRSDEDHQKKKTIRKGDFYLADFNDDPEFNDNPHLFLQEGKNRYREWMLPRDVPTDKDHQKKLVRTDNKVDADKVRYHTEGSGKKGREKKYSGTEKEAKSGEDAAVKNGSSERENLKRKSKGELYEMAQRANIKGRSNMDKSELIESLGGNH